MSNPCNNRSADEDMFTTINLSMLTTLIKIQTLLASTPGVEAVATAILDAVLGGNETSILFASRSVRDLTFGYQDPFLSELCKLDPEVRAAAAAPAAALHSLPCWQHTYMGACVWCMCRAFWESRTWFLASAGTTTSQSTRAR